MGLYLAQTERLTPERQQDARDGPGQLPVEALGAPDRPAARVELDTHTPQPVARAAGKAVAKVVELDPNARARSLEARRGLPHREPLEQPHLRCRARGLDLAPFGLSRFRGRFATAARTTLRSAT